MKKTRSINQSMITAVKQRTELAILKKFSQDFSTKKVDMFTPRTRSMTRWHTPDMSRFIWRCCPFAAFVLFGTIRGN